MRPSRDDHGLRRHGALALEAPRWTSPAVPLVGTSRRLASSVRWPSPGTSSSKASRASSWPLRGPPRMDPGPRGATRAARNLCGTSLGTTCPSPPSGSSGSSRTLASSSSSTTTGRSSMTPKNRNVNKRPGDPPPPPPPKKRKGDTTQQK